MGSNSASRAKKERVLLAMSGGVDSSLAALLLLNQGYDVVGVTFKLVDGSRCCDVEAVGHAAEVCRRFGIEHHVIDISREFDDIVVGYFVSELASGRTPNPCVICNRFLKFEQMFRFAREFKCEKVATGHYARIRSSKDGSWSLLKGRDRTKDQSYYLSFLKNSWLAKILFPIGSHTKADIYKLARKEGLDFLVSKKQSQDLCFVDDKLRKTFVEKRIGRSNPGQILSVDGEVLGSHEGVYNYTIGQRKGLDISDGHGPYFVVGFKGKDVIVSRDEKDPSLYSEIVELRKVNLVSSTNLSSSGGVVMAKIRYQQNLSRAKLFFKGQEGQLEFRNPVRAVTKGQVAVFYKGEICLGGGIIK